MHPHSPITLFNTSKTHTAHSFLWLIVISHTSNHLIPLAYLALNSFYKAGGLGAMGGGGGEKMGRERKVYTTPHIIFPIFYNGLAVSHTALITCSTNLYAECIGAVRRI